jgi:tetratricopeptide (TPR) repeat protein
MALNATGIRVTPDALLPLTYLPSRRGSLQVELLAAARYNGRLAYLLAPSLNDLAAEIAAGNPVIVLQNLWFDWLPQWHYAVAVGYDLERRQIILRSGSNARVVEPLGGFERSWRRAAYWAMLVLPPDRVPATAAERTFLDAVVALEKTGQTRAAQSAYAAALKRWPHDLTAMIGLGNTHYALGELKQSEDCFRAASLEHPDSVPAWNNLAEVLLAQRRHSEALEAARRAVRLGGPLEPEAQRTLEKIRAAQ